MNMQRSLRIALVATLILSPAAWAQVPGGDFSRLSSQYAGWAGGKTNSDALVGGLRNGAPITLVTRTPGQNVSLAGFTPAAPMTYGEVRSALASAQKSLARLGIAHPSAEQIQAALIGGDVELPNGGTRLLAGTIASPAG